MPIYEYKCENGHVFDVMQRMSDEPLTTCEQCEAPVQRVFHPVAVHFKGSGFYNTDYGTRRRQREAKESGEGAGAKSESGSGGSSESGGAGKADKGSGGSDGKPEKKASASTSSSSSSSSSD